MRASRRSSPTPFREVCPHTRVRRCASAIARRKTGAINLTDGVRIFATIFCRVRPPNVAIHCRPSRSETSRRSICLMGAARFASAVANSCVASFAVLRFEPAATMPASTAATAPAITDGSNWIAPITMATRTTPPPDPAGHDEFAAALDPGRQLIDLRFEPHDLVARIIISHLKPIQNHSAKRTLRIGRVEVGAPA